MKHISRIAVLGFISLSAFGCSDTFFEKHPAGSLSASKVTSQFFQEFRNTPYTYIGAIDAGYERAYLDGYADNGYARNSYENNGIAVQTNSLDPSLDFGYDTGYAGIRSCNLSIEEIAKFQDVDQALRTKAINEIRVLRAWLYMDLTLRFGDLPLITEVANDYPEGLARASASDIRSFVLKELQEASDALPETNDKGHFNKYMAKAVLARAAYYFGNYAVAEQASKLVIDRGGYRLHTVDDLTPAMQKDADYFAKLVDFPSQAEKDAFIKGIFNYQSIWAADGSPEVIIAKGYLPTIDNSSSARVSIFQTPNTTSKEATANIVPVQQLVDAYWTIDGQHKPRLSDQSVRHNEFAQLEDNISTWSNTVSGTFSDVVRANEATILADPYMEQFRNRDARLYASIVFPFSSISKYVDGEYQEYVADNEDYGRSGYFFRKVSGADDVVPIWNDTGFGSGVDYPLLRLAELYLIYAESHTQTSGYDALAEGALNKLRERVGMPLVPSGLSKTAALDFIRAERRIELAGEGHRFFDIRLYEDDERNGGYKGSESASAVMRGQIFDVKGNPGSTLTWASRLMRMPYPTSALDRNKNKDSKKNNPGYN